MVMTINPAKVKVAATATEQDLYDNAGTSQAVNLMIQVSNNASADASVELWITDASNNKLFPVLPATTIPTKETLTNPYKVVLEPDEKIRITADSTDVYAMIATAER